MDHVQTPEADVVLINTEDDTVSKSTNDKLHDSKHVTDFIQNEVQSYDNVFVSKTKPSVEVLENGDHPSSPEETEQLSPTVHVDLMNGSTHDSKSSVLLTPLDDRSLESEVQHELPSDIHVHSSTPGDVFSNSPITELHVKDIADISPIKVDPADTESHKNEDLLIDEAELFQATSDSDITGTVDHAQFHLHERAVDHVEEPTKPSDISIVPESYDLISNKPQETKSTPSPVEPTVAAEVEPPKSEPKIEKETPKATVCDKPAVIPKANTLERSEIGPKDFFAKYGLGECIIEFSLHFGAHYMASYLRILCCTI
ncbi:hypothetical protein V9T40_004207 [Parthenolecanium corni]|uniref:Uncharacterized protein n=1 Tax=Parthenolecanium corni TaxID=536013 RepID=A0AAN9YA65_9HEMI